MKKSILVLSVVLVALTACHKDIFNRMDELDGKYNNLDARVAKLEQLCAQMNTNISAIQTIIESMEDGDYITAIVPISQGGKEIGYTITFKKAASITIYHGKDGLNGEDGATPIIGVAKSTDGIYYWTLNGTWMLDENGNKVRVTGTNGKDGKDGTNGKDGNNGITPQLKIENGYWYISYNGGTSWTQLGKAVGENGKDGKDGKDGAAGMTGKDGETIFKSVDYDDNFVYFTLMDDTMIKVARFSSNTETGEIIKDGAIMAAFSVSDNTQVYFSMGNLFYQPSTQIWKFAEHQYDFCGLEGVKTKRECYTNGPKSNSGWMDLFGYGTSGYNGYVPYLDEIKSSAYIQQDNISGTNYDWGAYNAIQNGGNKKGLWRVLTYEEADYLLNSRKDALYLRFVAIVNDVKGLVLLPDNWSTLLFPEYHQDLSRITRNTQINNVFTLAQWNVLESVGAVFLPMAGYISSYNGGYEQIGCYYRTGTSGWNFGLSFGNDNIGGGNGGFSAGNSVRLVQDVK